MLPVEWVAGFVEGEATFSGSWRSATYYQPNFSLYQKERYILEQVQEFLAGHDISAKVYVGTNKCLTLSVNGIDRCKRIYDLLRPHMHSEYKCKQADEWVEKFGYKNRNFAAARYERTNV